MCSEFLNTKVICCCHLPWCRIGVPWRRGVLSPRRFPVWESSTLCGLHSLQAMWQRTHSQHRALCLGRNRREGLLTAQRTVCQHILILYIRILLNTPAHITGAVVSVATCGSHKICLKWLLLRFLKGQFTQKWKFCQLLSLILFKACMACFLLIQELKIFFTLQMIVKRENAKKCTSYLWDSNRAIHAQHP